MSAPKQNKGINHPASARRRGNRLFNALIHGSVISFEEAMKTPRTKLGFLLEKGLAKHSREGIKLTGLARWKWYERNGSNHTWEQLSPGKKQRLAEEFNEMFHTNQKGLLENLPARVKTPSQFFRHRANAYHEYAKKLYQWMSTQRGSNYEGAFSEYQRVLRLISIYQGIAQMIGEERRSQSIRRQPPHSL